MAKRVKKRRDVEITEDYGSQNNTCGTEE